MKICRFFELKICKDALFVTFGRCVDPIDMSSERVDIFGFYRHEEGENRLLERKW